MGKSTATPHTWVLVPPWVCVCHDVGVTPGRLGEAAAAGGLPCAAQSGQVMAACRASRDLGLVSGCRNHRSPGATGGRGRAHIASHFPKMSMFEHINITYNPGMIVQVLMEWFYGIDFQ